MNSSLNWNSDDLIVMRHADLERVVKPKVLVPMVCPPLASRAMIREQ